jgi:16S rRNA (cytosine1402-N4)-methyltransferase
VNDELTSISSGLRGVLKHLISAGRIVTIAFHEGEDSIVKDWFKDCEAQHRGEILTKKSISASEAELAINPRSRSARLRVLAKLI